MANIVIRDIPGASGTHELDLGRFTNAELRLIKKEAGVRAGEFEDAIRASDNDFLVALALIALRRSGREVVPDLLWEADVGLIQLDLTDEEDDVSPPDSGANGNAPPESSSPSSSDTGVASPES